MVSAVQFTYPVSIPNLHLFHLWQSKIASPQDHARSEHGPETSAVVPTCTPMEVVQSQTTQPLNSTPLTKIPGSCFLIIHEQMYICYQFSMANVAPMLDVFAQALHCT